MLRCLVLEENSGGRPKAPYAILESTTDSVQRGMCKKSSAEEPLKESGLEINMFQVLLKWWSPNGVPHGVSISLYLLDTFAPYGNNNPRGLVNAVTKKALTVSASFVYMITVTARPKSSTYDISHYLE